MTAVMSLPRIEAWLAEHGLLLRGGFRPSPGDAVPALPDGRAAASLLLIGNAGPSLWAHFSRTPEYADAAANPLDRWSRRILTALADRLGGLALLPSDGPPYHPFVAWAKRAEPVAESPLGMLVHPDYGLWHAYRGALALPLRIDLPPRAARAAPCETCVERPCLSACPVGAFGPEGYEVAICARHIAGDAGADCMDLGCRARRACPVGTDYRYGPRQARFHMEAFLAPRREEVTAR